MTLDGAINLNETNEYTICTMNSVTTGQYGVVIPKNVNGTLNMLVDLHMKSSFDGVISGAKTKDVLVSEISDEYNKLKSKYVDGMLVMPMIDETLFQSTVLNGDKQKMFDEVKKIGAITSELYKKLTESGIDKQKIDQKIIIVEKTSEDEKFVAWLKEQMPNFVDGILYSELNQVQEVVNPFVNSNDIFGASLSPVEEVKVEAPVVSEAVNVGGIFDSVAPAAPVEPVAPVAPVEPVVQASSVEPVVQAVPATPATSEVSVTNNNNVLFGSPESVATVNQPENVVVQNPTVVPVSNPTPNVDGPKPVEGATLEGTTTFSAVVEQPNTQVTDATSGEVSEENKKNKGFVNLAILLVVLVGVTFVSIKLGEYLYGVFGA